MPGAFVRQYRNDPALMTTCARGGMIIDDGHGWLTRGALLDPNGRRRLASDFDDALVQILRWVIVARARTDRAAIETEAGKCLVVWQYLSAGAAIERFERRSEYDRRAWETATKRCEALGLLMTAVERAIIGTRTLNMAMSGYFDLSKPTKQRTPAIRYYLYNDVESLQ